ncbi:serine hydrolase [Patescibacteria group bacterium]|nr:serine hydrolase [Patescibacteria group bacterium]
MAFLKRKKDLTKDIEEKSTSRKLKSLKKPTGKKKEEKKPWGKKERYLVLFVFVITVGTSAVLGLSSRQWKLPGIPRVAFPSFKTKRIVIEVDEKTREEREKEETVASSFREKTRNLSGIYGFYVVKLGSGSSYGYLEREVFEPASLNKLPVMVAMYMQAEQGNLDLETNYNLKQSDKVVGSGSLSSKPSGYELTYRDLVRLMGKESDNTSFNIARNILGKRKIVETIAAAKMVDTVIFDEEQKTTPYDIGTFFQNLWRGNLVSEKSRDELLGFLTDTNYEAWLAEGIPDGVEVAHKFGREQHVVNDAGIVFADEAFVLVIMSKGVVEREADAIFPELARIVYEIEMSE